MGWRTGPSNEDINVRAVELCYNAIERIEKIVINGCRCKRGVW